MKTFFKYIFLSLFLTGIMASCKDDNAKRLDIDGDTLIEEITINGQQGVIDKFAHTVKVEVPEGTDLSSLKVDNIRLSPGASCELSSGMTFNGLTPRNLHVVNGDVSTDYTLTVIHDKVEFLSFELDGLYTGSIDNKERTIRVYVPFTANIEEMLVTFTVNEETTVNPASGSLLDFSEPVEFTATHKSATVTYTAFVVKDDMDQSPKAFIGNTPSMDALGNEAKAACQWMMENVPNSRYVAVQDILDGNVKLDDFKMVWAHLDFTDWPGYMWDTRDQFNSYWLRGGAILASRDGARYINDVWRITLDQQSPNNMFGGDSYETLDHDLGFSIAGHESHPLYSGIATDADNRIILKAQGNASSGRTLQWFVDWDPYGGMEGWEGRSGAKALASGHDYDANCVTIAEFEPYEALKGFTSGRVITIGTPAYEWFDPNNAENPYKDNMISLTRNAINYLCQ